MTSGQVDVLDGNHSLQVVQRSTGQDANVNRGTRDELLEQTLDIVGQHGQVGMRLKRDERSIVIKNDGQLVALDTRAHPCFVVGFGQRLHLLRRADHVARLEERLEPRVQVEHALAVLERVHAQLPLVVAHVVRVLDGIGEHLTLERIHQQRLVHGLAGARERRQNEHARVVDLTRHVLLGDQVHAVADRRDQSDGRVAIISGQLELRYVLVDVLDGCPVAGGEAATDTADLTLELVL